MSFLSSGPFCVLALFMEMQALFSPKGDSFLLPLAFSSLGLVLSSVHRSSVNVACDPWARSVGLLTGIWPWTHPFPSLVSSSWERNS